MLKKLVFLRRVIALVLLFVLPFEAHSQSSNSRKQYAQNRMRIETITSTRGSMAEILEKEKDGKISGDRFKFSGKFGLGAESYSTPDSDSNGALVSATANMKYKILDNLETNLETKLSILRDRTQEGLGDSALDNGIRLKHGTVDWKALSGLKLSAGAIQQKYATGSNLLIDSDGSFPATLQQYQIGNRYIEFEVRAEQAIPTSRSLDSERQEKEKTPSFFMERASLLITPNQHIQAKPYFGSFRFKDLPSRVASEGRTRGNTVTECSPSTCAFQYGYEGIFFGTEGMLRFNDKFEIVGTYNEIQNNLAPEKFNTGRELLLGANLRIGEVIYSPQVVRFFQESDTSPAFYNSAEIGGNNLEGYMSGIEVAFTKYKFKIDLEYYSSEVINEGQNQNQKDRDFVHIGLETFNVEF